MPNPLGAIPKSLIQTLEDIIPKSRCEKQMAEPNEEGAETGVS